MSCQIEKEENQWARRVGHSVVLAECGDILKNKRVEPLSHEESGSHFLNNFSSVGFYVLHSAVLS